MSLNLLNLGCGYKYHPSWINVDFTSTGKDVIACDLHNKFPFDDSSFDVVYNSHLLEHFQTDHAVFFLKECYRILKPNGILRVVVPDLEQIVRLYIQLIDKAIGEDIDSQYKYEWILLELFDQMVRDTSGGDMVKYWRKNPMPAEQFIIERVGAEVKNYIVTAKNEASRKNQHPKPKEKYLSITYDIFKKINIKEIILKLFLRKDYEALKIGRFRLSGEIHYWMHDRYSLGKLLKDTGFSDTRVCEAHQSSIPEFNSYLLDIESDGSTRKPDSLFMEARKK